MSDERERIRERLPIATLVGEHVALTRAGGNLKGLCPFHKEKTPSFVVSPERGSFHCFGCGAGGDVFRFYMLINKVEFPDALRALAARTGVDLDPEAGRRKAAEHRAFEVLAAVTLYFQQALAGSAGQPARDYLARRGITRQTRERFSLGYLPDWGDGLRRELPARGVSEQELVDAGVLLPSEAGREPFCAFHQRLIFPIRDLQGRVCGFGGRTLGDGQPKYLNSRQSALFDKSAVLFTIEHAAEAIRAAGQAVIVEGYMDALRAHQDGFANVIASLGTAITARQLSQLARLASRVVLALDADPAGARAAAEAGVRATLSLRQDRVPLSGAVVSLGAPRHTPLELRIATLPEGRDPDEVIAADPDRWRAAIQDAVPVMDYLFELVLGMLDVRSPSYTQDLLSQLLPLVGQLPGVGLQQPYLERLAALTRIDTAALRGELARLRGEGRRDPSGRGRQVAERQRGGAEPAARTELSALRQQAPKRDRRTTLEEELLRFVLSQAPLPAAALEDLVQATLNTPARAAVLGAVLAAHDERQTPNPTAERIVATLQGEARELADTLLAGAQLPPVDTVKVPVALRSILFQLERLAQAERLREQGALLDQVDRATARELLDTTQDLVSSRNQLTRRMLEEQATFHLH